MHHTAESSSTVCIIPQSKAPLCASHRGVKMHTAESKCTPRSQNRNLWKFLDAFKGTIRRNPFRGEHIYIIKEKIWRNIFLFAKTKILTPRCASHRGVEFFELCDRISRRNQNWIRKYFSLFIRGPDGFESWKKTGGRKSCDTLPLTLQSRTLQSWTMRTRNLQKNVEHCKVEHFRVWTLHSRTLKLEHRTMHI